jgi:hypothetical protein
LRDQQVKPPEDVRREQRAADSPFVGRFVDTITRVTYGRDTHDVTTPDGHWDIVVQRRGGRVLMLQTGLITRPVALDYGAGDEYLAISFKPGVFLHRMPGELMVDRGRPLPTTSARAFALDHDVLEIPTFENAEGLVARLLRDGLLARDEIVEGVVEGRPRAISPRSVQRHFVHALGLTPKQLAQIQRANAAVALLQQGRPAADVAAELGYTDQPHLTHALKRLMGRTPGAIARPPRR